ncbi:unnamed protein product [Absidia cylindrospora]
MVPVVAVTKTLITLTVTMVDPVIHTTAVAAPVTVASVAAFTLLVVQLLVAMATFSSTFVVTATVDGHSGRHGKSKSG